MAKRELILETPGAPGEKPPPAPAEPTVTIEAPVVRGPDPRFTAKAARHRINGAGDVLCMSQEAALAFKRANAGKLPENARRVFTEYGWIYFDMQEPLRA